MTLQCQSGTYSLASSLWLCKGKDRDREGAVSHKEKVVPTGSFSHSQECEHCFQGKR